jgi:hypothetical protein
LARNSAEAAFQSKIDAAKTAGKANTLIMRWFDATEVGSAAAFAAAAWCGPTCKASRSVVAIGPALSFVHDQS